MKRSIRWLAPVALCLFTTLAASGDDAPIVFASGVQRVALIELYTSEGCSSCPPADRWMSRLKEDPKLWREFTPIALHVDYWDDLGWTDPFASARHSERQRQYVREGGARAVYTPGFFKDGREWRDWRAGGAAVPGEAPAGELRLRLDGESVDVHFAAPPQTASQLAVHVAVLGMNLETRVRAGENAGRVLRHDFVALGLSSSPLSRENDVFRASLPLPDARAAAGERAIVAWVSRFGQQAPLQSVGGYLPGHAAAASSQTAAGT